MASRPIQDAAACPNREALKVVAAAIIDHKGVPVSLPPPARHHTIIRFLAERGDPTPIMGEQGFLLSDGRFCRRKPAARVAIKAGQIEALKWPPNLYSEDLW